ncbi:MAG: cytochrome D1 domain-containing protein [Gammaproteobacteria bacterium]|nr:cytochrome D1 domain-containing protein [Gammaproteobacteria bacterium]
MNLRRLLVSLVLVTLASGCVTPRGTGDLGLVIERASGSVVLVDTTGRESIARVSGLGDLSHASVVYSRDQHYAYVFGRDGGLTKVDMLRSKIASRVVQGGNSIGGAISQDGRLVAVSNYEPGGVRVFDAATLELVADIPSTPVDGERRSKVVGLVDAPGQRFVFSLFDSNEIWIADFSDPDRPRIQKITDVGAQPYDALITPDGRYYIAGLFGDDGLALVDLWYPERGARRILDGYGRGEEKMPVYKMPHLEGWAVAGDYAFVPAVGRHEVLIVNRSTWEEAGRIAVHGQPVFVMARPDERQVWVNFAHPRNDTLQVIDVASLEIIESLKPGRAVMHMEFTPRGEHIWVSARDDNRVRVYDTRTLEVLAEFPVQAPSGIFFSARAHRMGL